MIDDFKREFVDKIRNLSQLEGQRDAEIAEALGCSRATVNRVRCTYDIPTANLRYRKDKECSCERCSVKFHIRRKERRRRMCDECLQKAKDWANI